MVRGLEKELANQWCGKAILGEGAACCWEELKKLLRKMQIEDLTAVCVQMKVEPTSSKHDTIDIIVTWLFKYDP